MEMVIIHGAKKWSLIAQALPGRIGKQCRERYTLFFLDLLHDVYFFMDYKIQNIFFWNIVIVKLLITIKMCISNSNIDFVVVCIIGKVIV